MENNPKMERLVLLALLLMTFSVQAQDKGGRTAIQGKINVSPDSNPGNISVYNRISNTYTMTNLYGQFEVAVKVGDTLEFSSLQYADFEVAITPSVVKKDRLVISLAQGSTQLEKVVVRPDLTGFIAIDVQQMGVEENPLDFSGSSGIVYGYEGEFRPDELSTVTNEALGMPSLKYGLNIKNIIKAIFKSKHQERGKQNKNVTVDIRKVYDKEFFKQYLDIDKAHINDFIFYADSHGLKDSMLKEGHQLELINFLIQKSKDYKALKEK